MFAVRFSSGARQAVRFPDDARQKKRTVSIYFAVRF
jgi:virulence-associated protein VagC